MDEMVLQVIKYWHNITGIDMILLTPKPHSLYGCIYVFPVNPDNPVWRFLYEK